MTGCNIKCRPTTDINIEDVCYKLNFLGQMVSFTGSVSGSAITIGSLSATYEENMAYLDVSSYVDDDKDYIPIVVTNVSADEKEARKTLNSICWYYRSSKKVQLLFTDTTYQVANSIQYGVSLIPTNSVSDGDNVKGITDGLDNLIDGFQTLSNLVTSLSSASTDTQYPSAKCVYDALQNAGGGADGMVIRGGIVFAEDSQLPTGDVVVSVDVSSYVEDGQDYMPIYSCYTNYEHLSNTITYDPTLKTVSVHVDHTYHIGHYIRGDLYLIPVERKDSNPTLPSGITNGLYIYEVQSATQHYIQTSDNLVTSLSSSSTDTQYPSAKCVYDIVGDVEALINAL